MPSRFNLLFNVFAAVSLIVSTLVALSANAKQTSPQTIVVFGDSLSAAYGIPQDDGWVALLQQRLNAQKLNYQVVNASISGETTSGGLSRFANMLKLQKPNFVLIELGGNDGLRGLNASETHNNLETMIQQAKKSKAKVLLIGMKIPPNYGLKYSRQFSENYRTLAKKHGAALVPFLLEGVAGNPDLIQADGLHPTAAAQAKILENVWPELNKILRK
ncbi:MAG TPA: arylesterase [Methylotenera sp.]|nr:arylesterase [Methylotenera sp.]HPV45567.1 arylesterase [Methylotenera sp.]